MLASVVIISLIALLVSYNIVKEVKSGQLTSASMRIEAVIEAARSCSVAYQSESFIKLSSNQINVICDTKNYRLALDDVKVSTNFPNDTLSFNKYGNVKRAGTINVSNEYGQKKITIGIGSSNVWIE